jgi:hypothetical protein
VSRFTAKIDDSDYVAVVIPARGILDWRLSMAALTRARARALPKKSFKSEIIKQFAMFFAAGIFVAVLILTYGLDLSPGLF